MGLPEIVCLKSVSNNKYLRYLNENGQADGVLQFSGEKAYDPLAQFEVVQANCGDGLIHLKSVYTNKYFVRWSPYHFWITPAADEPNENISDWSCTLFKPTIVQDATDTTQARLMHVQLGNYACLWCLDGEAFDLCLYAGSKDIRSDSADIVTILEWSHLLKLPKHVAFKGDNGKYIGALPLNSKWSLQFAFDDPNDPKAAHEVFGSPDGTVCIKSKYYDKYWGLDKDNMIVGDVTDPNDTETNEADAMFRVKFIDMNVVALLNMGRTWYCKRFSSTEDGVNLLSAATQSVDEFAVLEVKELQV